MINVNVSQIVEVNAASRSSVGVPVFILTDDKRRGVVALDADSRGVGREDHIEEPEPRRRMNGR